jgi:hypothetical protein
MGGYQVARLDEIPELDDGRCPFRPVRHHFGIESFGANAWTGHNAGDRIVNEHDESGSGAHEELYVVLHGRARFELDGQSLDAPEGTFVFVDRGVRRTAFAEEPGTTLLAFGGIPGEAYESSGWEAWAPINVLYTEGRYAEAADAARALVENGTSRPGVLYNLACCESLAGRPAAAVEHLRQAVEASDRYRTLAAEDSDFDPIRGEPAFIEILDAAADR